MWNYRIIKISSDETDGDEYGVYEVFYNNTGAIFAHDEKPTIIGSSVKEIKKTLKDIEKDINKYDVIDGDSLEFANIDQ
jgi:hypothetical protein